LVSIPYELLPLPEKGETVYGLNRNGKWICYAEVHATRTTKKKVSMVTLKVPREYAMDVRSFKEIVKNDVIICRCEDITEREILDAIDSGLHSFNELKKFLRVGMGPCQGNTCHRLVMGILSRKLGKPIEELERGTVRPPMKPVKMGVLESKENL
jgi:bacterioferritin-associated ferredoxin